MQNSGLDFQAIFSATSSPYLVLNPALVIVGVNNAYLRATQRRRDDLLGRYLFDAFPDNPHDPQATGVKNLRASLHRVLQHGMADTMPVQKYDIPLGDPKEGRFEERYWKPVNTPVWDEQGKLTHVLHYVEDATAQVRSEAALQESEKRFRALTSATADVIYRMSPDWKQMQQMDGRGYLKGTAALDAFRIEDYAPPEEQAQVRKAIDEAIRSKTVFALEHRVLRADGSYGWTYSRAVPMLDANGDIYEWIGAASDITERKRAEEKLRESDRRKDEFLAMLAHELRNPLAPIGAAAELLQLVILDEARVRLISETIVRQVKHMTSLVNDLLDVSRVTKGLVQLDNAPLDIRQIVADAVEQVTPLIQARRHHLLMHLAPDTTIVMGDRKRLIQVVANLVNNAAKYTHEGGRILVKTEVHEAHVLLEVVDNGIGMAPELIARIFDLFSQAEVTSDRSSGGLGLGLSLVKSLVELHGGTVSCESEGIDKGSKFTVYLPRLVEPAKQVSPRPDQRLLNAKQTLRVLVVDDNRDAAAMLAFLLEAAGHEVLVEHESARALERARIELPDVCLLDIGLPEMDGNELALRLRAQPETANAVLIAVTGYGQDEDRKNALAAGFDHHLVKPVDTKKLASILAEVSNS